MSKILLCDDDVDVVRLMKTYCELDDFEVEEAFSGMEAVAKVKEGVFDLLLMDVMMPNVDGFTAAAKIREFSSIPIVLLTAKSEEYDKIHGFTIGIDDFIVKPFSPREVMARIKAILKRSSKTFDNTRVVYEIGSIILNESSRVVTVDGDELYLTPKEFELLSYLIKNKKRVFTREQLLNSVWGYDYYGEARTVDTHIKSLRERLGENRKYLKTVWGIGYKLEEDN
ncbi:MAG: response regulator transcription factor [Lachnospirales bacterium]